MVDVGLKIGIGSIKSTREIGGPRRGMPHVDPEKAPFSGTEAPPTRPDCTWPLQDFPRIIVRTSIWPIFFQNKIPGSAESEVKSRMYLEKMISIRRFDLAVSKKISNLSGFASGCFQIFKKIRPDLCQLEGSPTIDRGPGSLVSRLTPVREPDSFAEGAWDKLPKQRASTVEPAAY